MRGREQFSSRWGLLLSAIGIAVGTGNIWRFPRIAASNDGGSFLIPWVIFLFLWSIPLIITEFALGKVTRYGTIGSFASLLGERFAWMGAFVGFVASAIMFYYSVVAGWCIRYLFLASTGQLLQILDYQESWNTFVESGWRPALFHLVAITIAVMVVRRGVVEGIEKTNRILVPVLLGLLVFSAIRAVTLPGAERGLSFLFTPQLDSLLDYRVWLQALTQNAWDTGAGWGLILTYAVYMRRKEDITLNAALIALGNNSVSLLAAITVFSTVFALIPEGAPEMIKTSGPGNTGLTFIWLPQLFAGMGGGTIFAFFFFLSLSFAAISSLISMVELATRILMDMKFSRGWALIVVYGATLLFGLPSALSMSFFLNQDWTWGIALMVSGGFMAFAVVRSGVENFRNQHINGSGSDIQVGGWYCWVMRYAIPAQVFILLIWWFSQAIQADPLEWWNPFRTESVGTCLVQWMIVLATLAIANRFLSRRTLQE